MEAELLKIANHPTFSFSIRLDRVPNVNSRWHFHAEVELIYLHRSSGMQFIGDSIKRFHEGDIILIGSNLPHYFKFDKEKQINGHNDNPYSTVIHFYEDFWGKSFLELPENAVIKRALDKAKRGILISAKKEPEISRLIKQLSVAEGHGRIVLLMETLALIGASNNGKLLSSIGFKYNFEESDKYRINLIYEYSFSHFKDKISLEKIAQVANLAPNSFCRYFKAKTRKTYFQFVNEIRVSHACKLLIEDEISIKQICYESGFNNFSSFHAVFKQITGKTPLTYKQHIIPSPVFDN